MARGTLLVNGDLLEGAVGSLLPESQFVDSSGEKIDLGEFWAGCVNELS